MDSARRRKWRIATSSFRICRTSNSPRATCGGKTCPESPSRAARKPHMHRRSGLAAVGAPRIDRELSSCFLVSRDHLCDAGKTWNVHEKTLFDLLKAKVSSGRVK